MLLPDLRPNFRKYEVAESYAQFYQGMYGQQYKFRVIGLKKGVAVSCRARFTFYTLHKEN